MDQDYRDRLPEVVDYFRANPTPPATTGETGQHIHIHHHYAPPAPPPPPPRATVAEQIVPYVWLALGALIIATICAMILAVVMVALLVGLVGVALAAAAIAYLIKTTRESQINAELAKDQIRRNRRSR